MASGLNEKLIKLAGLRKGSIEQRLQRNMQYFFLTALLIAITTVGWLTLSDYQFRSSTSVAQTLSQLHKVNGDLLEAENKYRAFLKDGDALAMAGARSAIEQARGHAAELEKSAAVTELVPGSEIEKIVSVTRNFSQVLSSGQTDPAVLDAGFAETREASIAIQAMVGEMLDTHVNSGLKGLGMFRYLAIPLLIWAGSAIVFSLTAKRVAQQDIVHPLTELTRNWDKLIKREPIGEIQWLDRQDEIGDQARAQDYFQDGVKRYDEMREKREKQRDEHNAMLKQLADKFERSVADVVSGVAAASSQLQNTAASMASTAEQSSLQTSDVSGSLSEASAGVTAAAAACDEFAMSIGEISRQAATSAELARSATSAAASADTTISALSDLALQVGKIVEMISTIAQRTNLLALNASIEAARGGEAGRGFAVVAAEVKELATQTGKATDEVSAQIRAIQDTTGASVEALRAIADQIKQLESTAVSIAAAVDQQSIAGQDLARSIDRAARSTEDVSANIGEVREASLATGSAANQVLTSSTELEQQASILREQVGDFLEHVRAA